MTVAVEADWRRRRRDHILVTAGRLFAEQSYDDVQVDEVARSAGVGKATLYRYFPSKETLFLEVFEDALARLEERFAEVVRSRLPPAEALASMLRELAEALGDQLRTLRILDAENRQLAVKWRTVYRRRRLAIVDALRRVLEAGRASGDFRAIDLEATPGLLIGMIRGGLVGAAELPRERVVAAAADLVLHGLAGAPPERAA